MAPAALQGQPRVLPPDVAWSYATGRHARSEPSQAERRALIVRNVQPPAILGLPPLETLAPDDLPAITLAGPEATPARVKAEMANATEIQLHTHALTDAAVSDAAFLALSPDGTGGPYALTAEEVGKLELPAHPLVVLAACRSAQGARYQHAPLNLPDAFLAAGARAVFATATDIPDKESARFFARVLARVRHGAEPAMALRDERVEALTAQPWVADVILFD
jgi:CHAT domain-containing protein